jgi:hypothetical protein
LINIYQGETAYIEVSVLDETGQAADLNGATAKFACMKGTELLKKDCTIVGNVVKVKLLPEDTDSMQGNYKFEIKLQDIANDVDTILYSNFTVQKSLIPQYDA